MLRNVFAALICNLIATVAVATTSFAQTSTKLSMSDPKDTYQIIKAVVLQDKQHFMEHISALRRAPEFDLASCTEPESYTGTGGAGHFLIGDFADDRLLGILIQIAEQVDLIYLSAMALGYPSDTWEPVVSSYEDKAISFIIQAQSQGRPLGDEKFNEAIGEATGDWTKQLVARMNAYQRTHASLTPVAFFGGCGAGEVAVRIATQPRAVQVVFIPTFFYELCRVQGLNPDDTASCNRWRESADGSLLLVSGEYFYIAKWSGDTTRKGKLRFTADDDGKTIILRKP